MSTISCINQQSALQGRYLDGWFKLFAFCLCMILNSDVFTYADYARVGALMGLLGDVC